MTEGYSAEEPLKPARLSADFATIPRRDVGVGSAAMDMVHSYRDGLREVAVFLLVAHKRGRSDRSFVLIRQAGVRKSCEGRDGNATCL